MIASDSPSPRFSLMVSDIGESSDLVLEFIRQGWCARRVRGGKMRTVDQLFDEVSAAFQFPSYFGENWPAFNECINDLEWVEWRSGFSIIITDAHQTLRDEPREQLHYFTGILQGTVNQWADPERVHWAKPEPINEVVTTTMPFRIVLQADQHNYKACRERWEGAGAVLDELDPSSWRTSAILEPHIDI